jgi:peptidoglycan L-alanyl-D-glutamate endopeptidase CwlK
MASRDLKDLHPRLQERVANFLRILLKEKVDILIYCTYRSNKEQADLYAQGRTKPGKIVTYAKPGQSKHNNTIDGKPASLAFDCVPLVNGKPVWDAKDPVWQKLGSIGLSVGLEWAGTWKKFREYPHFQLPPNFD